MNISWLDIESVDRSLTWLGNDLEACLRGEERKYAVTEAMLKDFP